MTWQHDNTSDLLLYTLSFGIHSKFYPPDLKYAVVSQAHIHFAENLKNCVVMWCKWNHDKWRFYGNNQCSLMNCCGRLFKRPLLKQLFRCRLTFYNATQLKFYFFSTGSPPSSVSVCFVHIFGRRSSLWCSSVWSILSDSGQLAAAVNMLASGVDCALPGSRYQ